MIQIADLAFPVASSEFLAFVSLGEDGWHVSWSIELCGACLTVDEVDWEPKVTSHAFHARLPRLEELPGTDLELSPSEDGEPAFLVYVLEHEELANARLRFGAWRNGGIGTLLTGTVDVLADEKYGESLPVRVELELPFDGVVVDEYHFSTAEEKLGQFFDRSLFGPPQRHPNSGVQFKLRERDA